ncbi:HAMP domain-containing methyl-accepting chemotaxis protein [Micromonospora sp. NPDC049679]|uniref:methyl-accepting chemotaxis protein n=1 Tax=Micromonospora sp. NPDC049679 TaxID=3155920 RepID=UPI0033DE2F8A
MTQLTTDRTVGGIVQWWRDLRIIAKVSATVLVVSIFAVLVAVMAFSRLDQVSDETGVVDTGEAKQLIVVVLLAGLVATATLVLLAAGWLAPRLRQIRDVLDNVAEGDLRQSVPVSSADEVGAIAIAANRAIDRIRATVDTVASSGRMLAISSDKLAGSAGKITSKADETSTQAHVLATAAQDVSRNVQTVAAGAEEMRAAIREVSLSADEAAKVASQAVAAASTTNATVAKLGDSSTEIGNVVKVITSIAQQTNLLALNATIEAARAGEAGKGFAVVANEVKDLAQETATATEDISRRVEAIQADTRSAVAAIDTIGAIIARISDYQTTIASAVEEQTATTREMSRNIGEAAAGSGEISENVANVALSAQATRDEVGQGRQLSEDLARMAADLRELTAGFRV